MRTHHRLAALFAIAFLCLTPAWAQRLAPEISVSNPQAFEVTVKTVFVVPQTSKNMSILRVWHALPTARPWDGMDRPIGTPEVTFKPESGRVQHLASNDSQHVFWEVRDGLTPGKKLEFTCTFRVRTADRSFDPTKCLAKWSDYPEYILPATIDATLANIVDEIKRKNPPAFAAIEFCKWIAATIKYDASVPHPPPDVATTLKECKGHCGHRLAVFEAMCARAGIPRRAAVGLNLGVPSGSGDLHKIRPDYENRHGWAQIYLPLSGWVEIEPAGGINAYSIPASCIQNSTDFQNYVVAFFENGRWMRPDWEHKDGKWLSVQGVENHISFKRWFPPREVAKGPFSPIDLQAHANMKLTDSLGSGTDPTNNLSKLWIGEQKMAGVPFMVSPKLVHLGSKHNPKLPGKVEGIPVRLSCDRLHFLHAACFGADVKDGTPIGEYRVRYDDQSTVTIPIVYGEDLFDWWVTSEREPLRGRVAWYTENPKLTGGRQRVRLFATTWDNPWPSKQIQTIDMVAKHDQATAAPFCVAITAESKP